MNMTALNPYSWMRLPVLPRHVLDHAQKQAQSISFMDSDQKHSYSRMILDGMGWGLIDNKDVDRMSKACLKGMVSEHTALKKLVDAVSKALNKKLCNMTHCEIVSNDEGDYWVIGEQPVVVLWTLADLSIEQKAALILGIIHISRHICPVSDYFDLVSEQEEFHCETERELMALAMISDQFENEDQLYEYLAQHDDEFEYINMHSYHLRTRAHDMCDILRKHMDMGFLMSQLNDMNTVMQSGQFMEYSDAYKKTESESAEMTLQTLNRHSSRYSSVLIDIIHYAQFRDNRAGFESEYDEGITPLSRSFIIIDNAIKDSIFDLLDISYEEAMNAGESYGTKITSKIGLPETLDVFNYASQKLIQSESIYDS